jgi:hypothetical protein
MIEIRNQNEVAMRERVLQVRKPVSGTPSSLSRAYAFRLHANRRAKTGCARSMRSMRPNGPDIRRLLRSMLASVLRCCLRSLLIYPLLTGMEYVFSAIKPPSRRPCAVPRSCHRRRSLQISRLRLQRQTSMRYGHFRMGSRALEKDLLGLSFACKSWPCLPGSQCNARRPSTTFRVRYSTFDLFASRGSDLGPRHCRRFTALGVDDSP